jgi:hypothetical protein
VQADTLLKILQEQLNLTWNYEQLSVPISSAILGPDHLLEIILPPVEILQQLHDLLMDGDTQEIVSMVSDLSEADVTMAPFAEHVTQLATKFQIKQLQALIECHLA